MRVFFPPKLNTLPTLRNNEPVPQVLKQVVNLSCYLWKQVLKPCLTPDTSTPAHHPPPLYPSKISGFCLVTLNVSFGKRPLNNYGGVFFSGKNRQFQVVLFVFFFFQSFYFIIFSLIPVFVEKSKRLFHRFLFSLLKLKVDWTTLKCSNEVKQSDFVFNVFLCNCKVTVKCIL